MTDLTSAEPSPLASFRWDYRIILVSTPAANAENVVSEFKSSCDAINERHILWFVLGGESVATNYAEPLPESFPTEVLKYYFKDASDETEVRLIGKDGGVKEKADALDLDRLFALIDSMPMRQAEMKQD
ncbi:MAG: DUF4174 domain-containing protein [Opitutales bacterium]